MELRCPGLIQKSIQGTFATGSYRLQGLGYVEIKKDPGVVRDVHF